MFFADVGESKSLLTTFTWLRNLACCCTELERSSCSFPTLLLNWGLVSLLNTSYEQSFAPINLVQRHFTCNIINF